MEISGDLWLADLTPVLETALDAVIVMKSDGAVAGWNAIAEATFGWSRDQAIGRQLSELIIPKRYREAHHRGVDHFLATGDGPLINRRVEISGLHSSGEEFPVELSITSTDLSGERVFLGFLRDISQRKAAERALKQSEARLAATYNHALVGISETDRTGRFIRANEQFSVMTGYGPDELRSMTFFDMTHPADVAEDRLLFEEQWSGARDGYAIEKRYVRKDGEIIWVEIAASLVRDQEDSEPFAVRIQRDITDKKRAEEQQRLLLNELNHRVKNTLAVVQGLSHQTFRQGGVEPEVLRAFEGRLAALAAAHNLLMQHTWEPTPIHDATEVALNPFQTTKARISVDGPATLLKPSATVTLTLALHELATNAAKYGALSNAKGTVAVRWTVESDKLELVWEESGGPAVTKPQETGFGTRLLQRAVATDLGATVMIDYDSKGVVCRISAPLRRITP